MRGVALGLTLCLLAGTAGRADESDDLARLDREATTFFAQFVKDRELPIETCMIEPEWSTYPISYEDAHAFLGLEIHANLGNIDGTGTPAKLLTAAGVAKDAVCDEAAWERNTHARVDAWQKAFKALAPGAKPATRGFDAYQCAYSFPAFDRDFKRAIVVEKCTGFSNFFDEKGVRKPGRISGGVSAETYRRDAKGWHKVETIEMATWD